MRIGNFMAKVTYPMLSTAMDSLGVTETTLTRAAHLPSGILPVMIPKSEAGWYVYVWMQDGAGYWYSDATVYGMPLYYRKESS